MLLAALVSTKSQAAEAAKLCQMQAHAGHETARIGCRPRDTIFGCCDKKPSSVEWLTAVSASWKKYNTPAMAVRLRYTALWNVAEMTLKINPYELTACHLNTTFWKLNEWKLGEIP
jgi:hypothetical protein